MRGVRGLLLLACAAAMALCLQCGTDEGPGPEPDRLNISPGDRTLEVSISQEFTADVDGQPVIPSWYVDGVRGGTPEKGMITGGGLYVAPSEVPPGGYVTLTAKVVMEATLKDSVRLTISKPAGTPYVSISPDTAAVTQFQVVEFSGDVSDCGSGEVTWSLSRLWGNAPYLGSISDAGLYEAPSSGTGIFAVMVTATSVDCPAKAGIAKVVFYPTDWPDIELESYTESNDSAGSAPIKVATCGGASGGLVVEGLDRAGEWIAVPVYVPATGNYQAFVRCQTEDGATMGVRVTMQEGGIPPPEADFTLTGGNGLG